MRQVRDGFANRFAKPSRTVAKRSHGIAKSSHASRTVHQSFKHVIPFSATKIIAKPSPSHRICCEPVANLSPTLRRPSQTHRKEYSTIYTMRQICDINETISRLNCDLMSHSCETLARMCHDYRETLARMSHDCRASVVNIIEYMS